MMYDQIQHYFAIIQHYFGISVAAFVALQPLLILLTSAAHAIEVQGRNRGWSKVQACGYWVAKVCGTFAAVDMRNVQRAGGKVFVILAEVIAVWAAKESKTDAVTRAMGDAGRLLILALALGAITSQAGCAGSLEESRGIANVSTVAGVPVTARQDALCSRYSNVEYATRIAGGVLAVAAGAAGFSAWPVKSDKWEHRLEVATAVSGTASVGSYWVANQQASLYIEKGCAK